MIEMLISDTTYLTWQKKLTEKKVYRQFWVFWGIYVIAFFYAGIVFFFLPGYRDMAILAFVAFLLARFVVGEIINLVYKKQRPFQRLNFAPLSSKFFLSPLNTRFNSMPSGHAASLFAISSVCVVFFPLLGFLGFIAAILNGAARVILGYHHALDIVAGWVVGLLSAFIVLYWLSPLLFTH